MGIKVSVRLTCTDMVQGGNTALCDTPLKERWALKQATTSMVWLKYCPSRGGLKATLKVAELCALMSICSGNTCKDTESCGFQSHDS